MTRDDRKKEELNRESPESRLERLKERPSWQPQNVEPEDGPGTASRIGPR